MQSEFQWQRLRVCAALGGYLAATVALTLWTSVAAAVSIALWLAMVVACVATDREGWGVFKRVGLVIGLWLAMVWPPTLIDPSGGTTYNLVFAAMSIVTLVIAMRRSRLFVQNVR